MKNKNISMKMQVDECICTSEENVTNLEKSISAQTEAESIDQMKIRLSNSTI